MALLRTTYGHFKKVFLAHEDEVGLMYKDELIIELIDYPPLGPEAACAYVRGRPPSKGIIKYFVWMIGRKDLIFEEHYSTREELIEKFRFEGKTLEELWPDLALLNEI